MRAGLRFKFRYMLLLAGILFVIICFFSSNVAEWYVATVYPVYAKFMSFFTSKVPFSLYDVFWPLLILLFFASVVYTFAFKLSWLCWLGNVLVWCAAIVCWFYLSWGISYFRKDFYERTSVVKAEFDSVAFREFFTGYIDKMNAAYVDIDSLDYELLDRDIERGYELHKSELAIKYPCGVRRIKPMLYEGIYSKMGISGYFGPFFNEVHVNYFPYLYEQPFVIAHEKAHQFGVSSEAECNLYAFIVCTTSDNAVLRYCGYYGALGYVLSNARRILPEEFADLIKLIRPEILEDYGNSREHWLAARNVTLANTQQSLYNAYLKSNKIQSGVQNYSEMVALLLSWYVYNQNNS